MKHKKPNNGLSGLQRLTLRYPMNTSGVITTKRSLPELHGGTNRNKLRALYLFRAKMLTQKSSSQSPKPCKALSSKQPNGPMNIAASARGTVKLSRAIAARTVMERARKLIPTGVIGAGNVRGAVDTLTRVVKPAKARRRYRRSTRFG